MRIGILGGSFNPVHNGHLRLGLETLEQMGLSRVDFVPALFPPHKKNDHILPFDLRFRMLVEAVSNIPGLEVNDLEGRRRGTSYTVDTLREYRRSESQAQIFFILGCNDFLTLPHWQDWTDLFQLSNFIVVGRLGLEWEQTEQLLQEQFASDFRQEDTGWGWIVSENTQVFYLEIPRLEISSTLIRSKWSGGKSLKYLLPERVEALLHESSETIEW